ncbi:MAG: DAK2 domain-containing protein [Clostridiales bacterium]|nr:DAK2 domain-containing protein [Clostridiales bacterium]
MIIAGANKLYQNKQSIDALNVFPVPDGDTGTNMSMTMLAAARECEKIENASVSEVLKAATDGSLRGARGNSGVILSQIIRGFFKGLEGTTDANAQLLADSARKAVETAYKAVMKPKEGTILTVVRAFADSAEKYAKKNDNIEEIFPLVLKDTRDMLLQTKEMLPVLKQADVVDAGGKGFLTIMEGAWESLTNEEDIKVQDMDMAAPSQTYAALASVDNESITYGYCTEFFIQKEHPSKEIMEDLKGYLSSVGDSLVVVNSDDVIKVHVHTDHPGLVLEKGLTIGMLHGLKIDNMRIQHTNKIDFSHDVLPKTEKPVKEIQSKKNGFVSISVGKGIHEVFQNLGVDQLIEGGQTMNPSTEDILRAIDQISAENIFVLPNNKNIILAAEQAQKLSKNKKVFVIPTVSIPQGVAAMISIGDKEDAPEKIYDSMLEGIKNVKTCQVTYAVRETVFGDTPIKENDILGMIDGDIAVVSNSLYDGTIRLLKQAIDEDSEVISIYYGSDVTEEEAKKVMDNIEKTYGDCEVELINGGQPLYYYIISIE